MIIRSLWRGEPRMTSAPNREMSKREAIIDIISMAQHARPKLIGQIEFLRPQLMALSSVVVNRLWSSGMDSSSWSTRANSSGGWLRWKVASLTLVLSHDAGRGPGAGGLGLGQLWLSRLLRRLSCDVGRPGS